MAMSKDDLLGLLYDSCLPEGALPELLASLESQADREEAIREVLRIVKTSARADGAWDAIREMPPFALSSGVEGDIRRFTELLTPFERGAGALAATKPPHVDFWEWQSGTARSMDRRDPVRDEARRRWILRCRADPQWVRAVGDLAGHYRTFASAAAKKGRQQRYSDYLANRQFYARLGKPDCEHVEVRPPPAICATASISLPTTRTTVGHPLPLGFRRLPIGQQSVGSESGSSVFAALPRMTFDQSGRLSAIFAPKLCSLRRAMCSLTAGVVGSGFEAYCATTRWSMRGPAILLSRILRIART